METKTVINNKGEFLTALQIKADETEDVLDFAGDCGFSILTGCYFKSDEKTKVTQIVQYIQVRSLGKVSLTLYPGDWVIKDSNGKVNFCPDEYYKKNYVELKYQNNKLTDSNLEEKKDI